MPAYMLLGDERGREWYLCTADAHQQLLRFGTHARFDHSNGVVTSNHLFVCIGGRRSEGVTHLYNCAWPINPIIDFHIITSLHFETV